MKYSQFVEFKELLEKNNVTLQEWLENPEIELKQNERLNEILGLKTLVSWGLKGIHVKKLKGAAKKFKEGALEGLQKAINPYMDAKKQILQKAGTNEWEELSRTDKQQINNIERKIENVLTKYISKVRDLKTESIYKGIEKAKGLKDSARLSLKYTWETLATEVETSLLSEILKQKVIISDEIKKNVNKAAKIAQVKLAKTAEIVRTKVEDEEKPKPKEGEVRKVDI